MTYSTITGERSDTAQHSLWNGTSPASTWQKSSWGKRTAAIAAALVPVVVAVATAVIRKKGTDTLVRKIKGGKR